ncbi:hypothetical protein Bacsa_0826 [Phocaeicola salanitronis DSM 18170]|uniref:Uncharacterized protein n=1 Tax=Phocaeicola salanitronis (strain DSM 18170 / JCM 13657 / CCUG 60908 / BL78) TaxID=667015 RepID=F0R287_PHOSB|nr:hypothetical protein Bacsa_0826 [Phocaeicola salanitronis DSM 18170]
MKHRDTEAQSFFHYQLILRISVPLCSMKDSHGFFTFNF